MGNVVASRASRGRTFYVDPAAGDDSNDGLAPSAPLKSYWLRTYAGGDTVLFKRGSIIRRMLETCDGTDLAPVTYGAYGDGPKPRFLGSVPAGNPELWSEDRPSVWRCIRGFPSEVCNLVFNGGESCGNLRWGIDELRHPGQWYYTGLGQSSAAARVGDPGSDQGGGEGTLYLYSPINPGVAYVSIECALWGQRRLVRGGPNVTLENLSFRNAGVHGYQECHARKVVIRNCEFSFIGGAVWNFEHRIRFGNAVEFWDGASDVTVEGCVFDNIYDAGVTHQGGGTRNVPERVWFRDNLFVDCGLAAYECREPSREIYFEHNTSVNAGGGFSMQGEPPPRRSEIYIRVGDEGLKEMLTLPSQAEFERDPPNPIDVGHHVFIWNVKPDTQPGKVYIRHNVFCEAAYGAAVYAIIWPDDMREFIFDRNVYWQSAGEKLACVCGRTYGPNEFERYREEWGVDRRSVLARPRFMDEAGGDYRVHPETPYADCGIRAPISLPDADRHNEDDDAAPSTPSGRAGQRIRQPFPALASGVVWWYLAASIFKFSHIIWRIQCPNT